MDLSLSGRNVLITGGSKGIGLACAEAFAAEGARLALCSRDPQHLDAAVMHLAARGCSAIAVAADLARRGTAAPMVAEVEARLGPLDVLVCSAGAAKRTSPDRLEEGTWHDGMDSKYFATVHAIQAVLPGMRARHRGAIVSVIGQGGKVAQATHLAGGAANAALQLLTAGLAAAAGPDGVRVNAVSPGRTLTERALAAFRAEGERLGLTAEAAAAEESRRVPLRRFGRPEEVAQAVLFLASDRASYVTGAILSIDGGAAATVT